MHNQAVPPYFRPYYEGAHVHGTPPHHHYHYSPMPMTSGCCGGPMAHVVPHPVSPMVPMWPWGMPYAPNPVYQPTTPMMPPGQGSYRPPGYYSPVWESPESPESPWIRAYRKQEQNQKGKE
ncbi:hypothetical protein CLV36_101433 [Laceyella sediminis]|uniref:Spore coat protein D n=1 Tax=Laceyella sediminis TaxID=573074 RepID=A0ABX5EVX7_9BACL|nr:hypothetical protein [Laceyella sediminis]PRZ17329.1 hypothetical protein CLV36_101433 [Laceyella sediminis]